MKNLDKVLKKPKERVRIIQNLPRSNLGLKLDLEELFMQSFKILKLLSTTSGLADSCYLVLQVI